MHLHFYALYFSLVVQFSMTVRCPFLRESLIIISQTKSICQQFLQNFSKTFSKFFKLWLSFYATLLLYPNKHVLSTFFLNFFQYFLYFPFLPKSTNRDVIFYADWLLLFSLFYWGGSSSLGTTKHKSTDAMHISSKFATL